MANLNELVKSISERLSPSDMRTFTSLTQDFRFQKIGESQFLTSLLTLFQKYKSGEIREHLTDQPESNTTRAEIDANPKEDVSVSEGKKRGIMHSDQTERTPKKTRTSRPRQITEQVITPSYKLIPEDKQPHVSNTALNNKCFQIKTDACGSRELTDSEKAMAMHEDDIYETDMLVETLKSAVERAEKVMREEIRKEDIGVKFYRCIGHLYRRDMVETVQENHRKALPVILNRLKQKLDELTVARESNKSGWKQVFKQNSQS